MAEERRAACGRMEREVGEAVREMRESMAAKASVGELQV